MRWLHRWRWFVLMVAVVCLLAGTAGVVTLPLRDSDKTEAARNVVAWIVAGHSVRGFGEPYPDARWMPEMKRFFVVCDFVPPEVSLSADPRVVRITAPEHDAVFEKHRFDDTDYLFIELKSESASELTVELANVFAPLAGHGYRFKFRRNVWGLRASGTFLWVS